MTVAPMIVVVHELPCPDAAEDAGWISSREAADLAALFNDHWVAELLTYTYRARIGIERIAVSRRMQ